MNETMILKNIVKMYGTNRRAVNDVSLYVREKERVEVYGSPGSGKCTLMRMIAGMEKPSAGSVKVLGEDVHNMDEDEAAIFRNKNIGTVFSESGFMERLNVLENVALPLAVQRISHTKRNQMAREQLEELGMAHIAHAYQSQLSNYEAAMASLARALITKPKILLLYEIMADLSLKEKEEMMGVINAFAQYGSLTIMSFNAAKNTLFHANRRIQLKHGKILEDKR